MNLKHKQGDTFEWVVTVTEGGAVANITDWGIRAQIRNNDTLIASLTITKTDALGGVFSATATAAQTDNWAAGVHKCDIEFTDADSIVFSTDTFDVTVIEDISHD